MKKEDSKKTQGKSEEICKCVVKEIYGNSMDGFKCGNCGKKVVLFEPTDAVDIL